MIQYRYEICNMAGGFPLIFARELTKRYGEHLALDKVSFTIEEGQVVGLLGLNGAGKSTTMNILTGCISATGGTVTIGGHDIASSPRQAKRITGYLPEQPAFYPEMKVRDHLDFICGLKGVTSGRKAHIADICRQVGLEDKLGRMVRNLSKGYRQRLGLAQALVGKPRVIILDEPTVGLDPSQIVDIRLLIKDIGRHSTVIVSSHILSEIQAVCARIIMLQKGRLIADCSTDEMAGRIASASRVRIRVLGAAEEIMAALAQIPGLNRVRQLAQMEPNTWDFALECADGADIRVQIFKRLAAAGLPLLASSGGDASGSLEEAFLNLAASGIGEKDAP